MSRSKFYFVFSTGAIVPNTGDGISEKKYFLIGMGQQTQDFKGQAGHTGDLSLCVHEGLFTGIVLCS